MPLLFPYKLHDLHQKGVGTLTTRFKGTHSNAKGELIPLFIKVPRASVHCSGNTSREIAKNDIVASRIVEDSGFTSYFQGITMHNGVMLLAYQYLQYEPLHDLSGIVDGDEKNSRHPMPKEQVSQQQTHRENLALEEIIDITIQLARKVHQLHTIETISDQVMEEFNFNSKEFNGIIHMDITPSNILINDNGWKKEAILLDYGISRERGKELKFLLNESLPGQVRGSYYASDDQMKIRLGNEQSPLSLHNPVYSIPQDELRVLKTAEPFLDTYNLVNVMCLLLTGRLMEGWRKEGNNETPKIIEMLKEKIIKYPKKLRAEVDYSSQVGDLVDILQRGTSEQREERYLSAQALVDDLEKLGIELPAPVKAAPLLRIPQFVQDYARTSPLCTAALYKPELELAKTAEDALLGSKDILFPGSVMGDDGLYRSMKREKEKNSRTSAAPKKKRVMPGAPMFPNLKKYAIPALAFTLTTLVAWTPFFYFRRVDHKPEVFLEYDGPKEISSCEKVVLGAKAIDSGGKPGFSTIEPLVNGQVKSFSAGWNPGSKYKNFIDRYRSRVTAAFDWPVNGPGQHKGGEIEYSMHVTDKAGQIAKSNPVVISYKEYAPTVEILEPQRLSPRRIVMYFQVDSPLPVKGHLYEDGKMHKEFVTMSSHFGYDIEKKEAGRHSYQMEVEDKCGTKARSNTLIATFFPDDTPPTHNPMPPAPPRDHRRRERRVESIPRPVPPTPATMTPPAEETAPATDEHKKYTPFDENNDY